MSRYKVDIRYEPFSSEGELVVADNGLAMERQEIVDRLNAYEDLFEIVRVVFPDIRDKVFGSWTVPESSISELMKRLEAIDPPKTEAELLEDRLKAADALDDANDKFSGGAIGHSELTRIRNAYKTARAAHEEAKS